ncbi:MAG: hypothetical protein GY940_08705, partial [bacterium]|nr:hypothetical protein [bacterium]
KKLVQIWSGVLNKKVGINDNFFHLGGDSINAIQVAARLREHGLNLEIADLFSHPVISQLAAIVKKMKLQISQEPVNGTVPLTPVQYWFFERIISHPYHFNHAVMLYRQEGFSKDLLVTLFAKIAGHHDALRMVYSRQGGDAVVQENRGLEGELFHLEVFHFEDTIHSQIEKKIQKQAHRLQSTIDLEKGPPLKLGLFKTANGDHMLIVVHHLVSDGISWRILL